MSDCPYYECDYCERRDYCECEYECEYELKEEIEDVCKTKI